MKSKILYDDSIFPPIILYKKDIIEIERILNEVSEKLEIHTKEHEFESIDELIKENKGPLKDLEFRSFTPYIRITLNHFKAEVSCDKSNFKVLGAKSAIDNILKKKKNPFWFYSKGWFQFLSTFIAFGLAYVILSVVNYLSNNIIENIKISYQFIILVALYGIILFVNSYFAIIISSKKHSIIHLINKNDRNNFFVRNKDQIVLSVIAALVGSLLTWFFTSL